MARPLAPTLYAAGILLVTALLLAGVATLNWLVNPYLLFNPPRIAGVNEVATENFFKQLLIKPHQLHRLRPQAVIIGTSHAGIAFNPDQLPQPAFNLAVGGATSYLNYRLLQEALVANPDLQQVILEVPMFAFNALDPDNTPGHNPEFEQRLSLTADDQRNPTRVLYTLRDYLGALLSWESCRSSFRTLRKQDKVKEGKRGSFIQYRNGQWLQQQGPGMPTRRYFENSWKKFLHDEWAPAPHHAFALAANGSSPGLDYYRQSLALLHQHKVHTVIVMAPMHTSLMLALQESGLWPVYAEWKKHILVINEAEAAAQGHTSFEVLDYSTVNALTEEPLPIDDTSTQRLRWFFDSAHATPEFGDRILQELREPDRRLGHSLTLHNLSAHLAQQERDVARYTAQHPDELAAIRRLAQARPTPGGVSP